MVLWPILEWRLLSTLGPWAKSLSCHLIRRVRLDTLCGSCHMLTYSDGPDVFWNQLKTVPQKKHPFAPPRSSWSCRSNSWCGEVRRFLHWQRQGRPVRCWNRVCWMRGQMLWVGLCDRMWMLLWMLWWMLCMLLWMLWWMLWMLRWMLWMLLWMLWWMLWMLWWMLWMLLWMLRWMLWMLWWMLWMLRVCLWELMRDVVKVHVVTYMAGTQDAVAFVGAFGDVVAAPGYAIGCGCICGCCGCIGAGIEWGGTPFWALDHQETSIFCVFFLTSFSHLCPDQHLRSRQFS